MPPCKCNLLIACIRRGKISHSWISWAASPAWESGSSERFDKFSNFNKTVKF